MRSQLELNLIQEGNIDGNLSLLLNNMLAKILTFGTIVADKKAYCPKTKREDCTSPFACLITGCARK